MRTRSTTTSSLTNRQEKSKRDSTLSWTGSSRKIMAALSQLLEDKDTAGFIGKWRTLVEHAFIKYGNLEGKQIDSFRGHGRVHIEERKMPYSGDFDKHRNEMKAKGEGPRGWEDKHADQEASLHQGCMQIPSAREGPE